MPAPADLKPQTPGEAPITEQGEQSSSAQAGDSQSTPEQEAERLARGEMMTLVNGNVSDLTASLGKWTPEQLQQLRELEALAKNRSTALAAIDAELAKNAESSSAQADALPASLSVVIAGALFDFVGFLTARDKVIALGATEEASHAVEAIEEWAATRGLSLDEAAVGGWRELGTELAAPLVVVDQSQVELSKAASSAIQPSTAGQAVLTDAGWVVPEPSKKD